VIVSDGVTICVVSSADEVVTVTTTLVNPFVVIEEEISVVDGVGVIGHACGLMKQRSSIGKGSGVGIGVGVGVCNVGDVAHVCGLIEHGSIGNGSGVGVGWGVSVVVDGVII